MISPMIHARCPLKGLATALALASVIATPVHGRAESRTGEHRPHMNAARSPAPMFRTGTAVAFPTAQMPPVMATASPPAMDHPRATNHEGDHDHHDRGSRVIVVVVPSVVFDYGPPLYSSPPADSNATGCAQNFAIYDPKLGAYVDDAGNLYHCP